MRISIATLLSVVALMLSANVSYSDTPSPGKQVAQSVELPASTDIQLRPTAEQQAAEKARREALTPKQRAAEDKERRERSLEAMLNPKPLSETETQEIGYWLFLPKDYDAQTEKTWPLLLFLHGMDERGNDIEKVKMHGPPKLLNDPEKAKEWPFITVSPQCPDYTTWSPIQLWLLLDKLEKQYAVDKDRIYVTGLSMGGFGTWGLLHQFPERFAAGAPVCGGFNPAAAKQFVDIPLWVFHGEKDPVIRVAMSIDMVEAIKNAGGNHTQLTLYPDLQHNSWSVTYDNPELFRWLLKQKRGKK